MNQVTEDQFFAHIGKGDVISDVHAEPNAVIFKMRYGSEIVGKIVKSPIRWERATGKGNTYFISNN